MEILLGLAIITYTVVLALVWALGAGCPHCGGDISNGSRFVFPICRTCGRDRRLRATDSTRRCSGPKTATPGDSGPPKSAAPHAVVV